MNFNLVTIFPEITKLFDFGVIGKAIEKDLISMNSLNPRDFSKNTNKNVDDAPYGGGEGMVMMAEPLALAMKSIKNKGKVLLMSPQGERLSNTHIDGLLDEKSITIICGRYEGIDERFIENYVDKEFSIGDFVLSGGEIPALALIDALSRKIPGVLGNQESFKNDSFENNLLKGPVYTRPQKFEEKDVPEILLSGDHEKINDWKILSSLQRHPSAHLSISVSESEHFQIEQMCGWTDGMGNSCVCGKGNGVLAVAYATAAARCVFGHGPSSFSLFVLPSPFFCSPIWPPLSIPNQLR